MRRRSRLQRVLDPIVGTGTHIFQAIAGNHSFNHDDTQQITITRGSTSRAVGYQPATVEFTVIGNYDGFPTGSPARVLLRDVHVDRLAAYIGVGRDQIVNRYQGRTGMVKIDDRGRSASTTFTGASWMTQLHHSPRHVTPAAGELIGPLLSKLTFMDNPVRGTNLVTRVNGAQLQHHAAGEPRLFKDSIGPLAGDIGIVLHEQRDGTTVAWGHAHREWWAANRMSAQWPLMRHQAIAPATYEQLGERPPSPIDYTTHLTSGSLVTRAVEPNNPTGETVLREAIDWSRWRISDTDNQLWRAAWARAHEHSPAVYTLPSVSIDMLTLLRQGTEYTRKIAGQILTLEAGEPVYLSGDWSPRLRGVHYADGIKETITPGGWRFELSLVPHALAAGTPTPAVPPIAWDSFITAWDAETRTWDQ